MARVFLNLRFRPGPAGLAVDLEGDDLPTDVSPYDHALEVARDLARRTRMIFIRDWYACTFEVTDDGGRPIVTVPFTELVPE